MKYLTFQRALGPQCNLTRPGGGSMLAALLVASLAHGGVRAEPATETESAAATPAAAASDVTVVSVTAQRRREPVREVPLSVTVLGGEALEQGGNKQLKDFVTLLPGVDYSQAGGGGGGSQITMRGVSTGAQVGPTVSVYVDDVPYGSSTAFAGGSTLSLDLGLFDIERIELLRGPQGTLYGAGAMGGLLKYVTLDPDTKSQAAKLSADVATTEKGGTSTGVQAMANLPIKEGVAAVRLGLYKRNEAGYIHDANHDMRTIDDSTMQGLRASLLVTPSKDTTLRFTAQTQESKRDGGSAEDVDIKTGRPLYGDYVRRLSADEPFRQKYDLLSATIESELGWARFHSITSYQKVDTNGQYDVSNLYVPLLGQAGINNAAYSLPYTFYTRKATQEFRLVSPSSKRFEWLAGAFYTRENSSRSQDLLGLDQAGKPDGALIISSTTPSTYRETALYGNATVYLSDAVDVTLGMRYGRNTQAAYSTNIGILAPPPAPGTSSSENTSTYLATIRYRLSKSDAVYLRAASGYRPGGPLPVFRNPLTGEVLTASTFKSDTLWSYEAGWKSDFLQKRLSLEAAAYYIDWKDIQMFTSVAGFSGIGNASKAKSQGVELTLTARPMEGLNLSAAISAVDARLKTDSADLGGRAGDRLPNSARFSAALQADYRFDYAGHESYVGASMSHVGDRLTSFAASQGMPLYRLPAFTTLDLRAGTALGRYRLGLFVRNLGNVKGQTAAATTLSPLGGPAQVSIMAPRTLGLQLSTEL
ncbi:TonB-dependent receptor [Undibacterium arcticum]|uniref:TonB-dependent receptor n=1 Tax=Undibacterium arcticum TaxID=1762892 RepID=A0ABV7F487_9BURK